MDFGNPGQKYENTRHNAGFVVIDKLAQKFNISFDKMDFEGLIGNGKIEGEKAVLVKPQTYMNLSGECVSKVLKFYKVDIQKLIVVYDDVDLPIGKIRIRPYGSAGTHNGMRSIINLIQSEDFARVRVGTGKPMENEDLADYVLRRLTKEEKEELAKSTDYAVKSISEIIKNGCQSAMNLFN